MQYVSETRRHIRYFASFDGMVKHGETYAHSFDEVKSQLEEGFANKIDLINIQFLD